MSKRAPAEKVFEGFAPSNTTPVPDILFDELMTELSNSELRAMLYIIRRTWGFKKDTDAISLNQFLYGIKTSDGRQLDKGCGIKDRKTLVDALTSLEEKGYIESVKEKTSRGDYATTVYKIRFKKPVQKPVKKAGSRKNQLRGSGQNQPGYGDKSNHRTGEKPTTVVGSANLQETVLQKTVEQQTVKQEGKSASSQQSDHSVTLTSEEQSFHDLYYSSEIAVGDSSEITLKKKQQYAKLAPYVKTMIALMSLYAYTKARIKGNDPTVYLGNLVKCRSGWWQTYQAEVNRQPVPTPPVDQPASMTQDEAEQLASAAIAEAGKQGYTITAQPIPSKKVEGAWLVKIAWPGVRFAPVKSSDDWHEQFTNTCNVLRGIEEDQQKEHMREALV